MSDHIDKTIEAFRAKLEHAEEEVIRLKMAINVVCEVGGRPAIYKDADLDQTKSAGATLTFSNDAFYGKPLATCMKLVLEARKSAGLGAASTDELYQALANHGYHFEGKEENRKTIVRTALRKNPDFHRLPHGGYGLREWYARIKSSADAHGAAESNGDTEADEEAPAANDKPETPKTKKSP